MRKTCDCEKWAKNMPRLYDSLSRPYQGDSFDYCPWCGSATEDRPPVLMAARDGDCTNVEEKKPEFISLTSVTVRELQKACEKAVEEKISRIIVSSPWSRTAFSISVETEPHSMESLGYKTDMVKIT